MTIAAVSTALSPAGIAVIRISGDDAVAIADRVFRTRGRTLSDMAGYTCAYGAVFSRGEKLDEAVATVFRAPHSYTGEDVVELSCHGGTAVTLEILRALYDAGAVPAGPGEFTKRAFLGGKLDLIEAESVMDIIRASSSDEARAAVSVKDGRLSRAINALKETLLSTAAHLGAWADYPEEDIPEVDPDMIETTLNTVVEQLVTILGSYDNGRLLTDGINTVIVGKPNVGKSTLMNLLSGEQMSIVTDIPGTTRDSIEAAVRLGSVRLNLTDTAGLREADNEIERIGVSRTREKLRAASLIICVFDTSEPLDIEDRELLVALPDGVPAIAICNKTDLSTVDAPDISEARFSYIFSISAKYSTERERAALTTALQDAVRELFFDHCGGSGEILLYNERQRSLTERALNAAKDALSAVRRGETLDAVTVAIEDTAGLLAELTGERVTDEVVDRVFHHFCVGK